MLWRCKSILYTDGIRVVELHQYIVKHMSYFICCRVTSVYSHLSSLEMQQYIVHVSVCFMSSFSRNICCLVSLTSCKIKRLVQNINKRILYAGFADQLLIMSKTV